MPNFTSVSNATNFGFNKSDIDDWKKLANTELPTPNGSFRSIEDLMNATIIKNEALRVLASFERHGEGKTFAEWIDLFMLWEASGLLDSSNPLNHSSSTMSVLEDSLRASFWHPLLTDMMRNIALRETPNNA